MTGKVFQGFPTGKVRQIYIPEPFFSEIMPAVDNLYEMKVILYAFWFLQHQEGAVKFIRYEDLADDEELMESLAPNPEENLREALERATFDGILLRALPTTGELQKTCYFFNTPRGRAAIKAIDAGDWSLDGQELASVNLQAERPNIFRLYEENIGPLTPLISDTLQEAEKEYSVEWIEEAIEIAVHKNVRNWRYIEAILESWQKEGRHEKDRRDSQEDRRKYIQGEYGDIIEY
jgi:DNA replication protein